MITPLPTCPFCGRPLDVFFESRAVWLEQPYLYDEDDHDWYKLIEEECEGNDYAGVDRVYSCGYCRETIADQALCDALTQAVQRAEEAEEDDA